MKDGKQIVCYLSLKEVNEKLPVLVRISSSILINELELRSIRKIGAYAYLKLSNGEKIKAPLRSEFLKAFMNV